jgi:transcriptional regulator with XRE-family HTH domain
MQNEAAVSAGQSIRAVRELAGLTLAQAAKLTGRSTSYLSLVENGKASTVSVKYIANTIGALSEYIANPVGARTEEHAA